jgi:DNA-binding CsgD family transcriptional regulator
MKPQELIYARESGYRHDIGTGHDDTLLRPSSLSGPRLHHADESRDGSHRGCTLLDMRQILDLPTPSEARVRAMFGLTAAEARLAQLLASGDTLEEVAEKLSIKLTTARSQLAIIFSKAGIRRQTKLVAILSRIAHLERRAVEAA